MNCEKCRRPTRALYINYNRAICFNCSNFLGPQITDEYIGSINIEGCIFILNEKKYLYPPRKAKNDLL